MKEKNKPILENALKNLPVYRPPEDCWQNIIGELDRLDTEEVLQKTLEQLPLYTPPSFIWDQIEEALPLARPKTKIRRLYPRIVAAAAAAVALVFVFNLWPAQTPAPQIAYSIEEKEAAPSDLTNDWDADEESIREVLTLFEQSPKAIHAVDFQLLKEEFNELNDAKGELESIMQKYGKDPDMIAQLKEIEIERSTVVKKMAARI